MVGGEYTRTAARLKVSVPEGTPLEHVPFELVPGEDRVLEQEHDVRVKGGLVHPLEQRAAGQELCCLWRIMSAQCRIAE